MNKIFSDLLNKYKYKKQIQNFGEYVELSSNLEREICISTITPQVADLVDKTIRFWNLRDEEEYVEMLKREPIKIYINSSGGDFNAMMTIMDAIKMSRTPVYTINTGITQKEAFYIYLIGHQRYCYPRSTFLFERDLKQLCDENSQNQGYINFYEKQLDELKDILLDRSKVSEAEYNKHAKNSWWISADDAARLKICNEILNSHNFKK